MHPYDPVRDFAAITTLAQFPMVIAVNPLFPAKSLAELVALAKSRPGELAYSHGGATHQVAAEMFNHAVGIEMRNIPYKGGAPAVNAAVAGDVPIVIVDSAAANAQIRAGRPARARRDFRAAHAVRAGCADRGRIRRSRLRHCGVGGPVRAGGHTCRDRVAAVPGSLARNERAGHEGKTQRHRHGPGRNGARAARRDDQGRYREIRRDRQGGQYPVRTGPSKAATVPLSPFFFGAGEKKGPENSRPRRNPTAPAERNGMGDRPAERGPSSPRLQALGNDPYGLTLLQDRPG